MKRSDKILKLANAIREYRGIHEAGGKWRRPPNLKAETRVTRWAIELGLDPVETLKAVRGFKTFDDMQRWMKTIGTTEDMNHAL